LSPSRALDALLFDLGGVVIGVDWGRVFQAWARAGQVPATQIAARFAFDERYEAHERGEIGAADYCAHLRSALGVALADDDLLAGWNCLFVGAVPAMPALLERLARVLPLYALSNTNRAHLDYWQPRYGGLLEPFSAVYCSCELGVRKPDAAAFGEVAKRIGVAPERILFFDDTEANVLGARQAGLPAAEVHSAADVREALGRFGICVEEAG